MKKIMLSLALLIALCSTAAAQSFNYSLSQTVIPASREGVNDWQPSLHPNIPFNGTGYQAFSPSLRTGYMGYPQTHLAVKTVVKPTGISQWFVDFDSWKNVFGSLF